MSRLATPGRKASEREADLRLATLHLRCGMHALARAELEALAGRDVLDRDGILDLAEVRWRTGDIAGAGVAAGAWLEDGEDAGPRGTLAHVIGAEAAAARGALDEAAAHVEAAAAGLDDARSLDQILAGIVGRAAWPGQVPVSAATPAHPASPAPGPARVAMTSPPAPPAPVPAAKRAAAAGMPLAPSAAELVAAGAALLGEAPERAAIVLALALRADRAAADAVLAALGPAEPEAAPAAALAFVRAEALRAAGRHDEARIAYASAERLALAPAEAGTPRSPQ